MRSLNSNKNKLNSKINWQKINYPNGQIFLFFNFFFMKEKSILTKKRRQQKHTSCRNHPKQQKQNEGAATKIKRSNQTDT